MSIHLAGGFGGPSAATCEIIRQHLGNKPQFTLIVSIAAGHTINLIHCGLVSKLIFSACANVHPASGPSPVMQRAYTEKIMETENWSFYSLQQRLMAGALGLGFMPTKCILGSSMAAENADSFKEIDNPFIEGKKAGVVKALNPDISVIHGWAADQFGNTILGVPYGGDIWGVRAGRGGVVVTVEKLVSTDFIRQHSSLVKIPGYLVNSVSVAPLGSHPFFMASPGIGEFDSYEADHEFLEQCNKASVNPEALDLWIKNWVLDSTTHDEYLDKLGKDRIISLKKSADGKTWKNCLPDIADAQQTDESYNSSELMAVIAARKIRENIIRHNHKAILVGTGISALAASLAYYRLRDEGIDVELIGGAGEIGGKPRPPAVNISISPILTCKMLTDTSEAYGVLVGGDNNRCLSVLGGAQVDKHGNINSTLMADGSFLVGSGGANDATNAEETIVIAKQSKRRFVDQTSYITCSGERVKTLVSTMGIFEKLGNDDEFTLTAYVPDSRQPAVEERTKAIKENCGCELKISQDIEELQPPEKDELSLLRALDPNRYFIRN